MILLTCKVMAWPIKLIKSAGSRLSCKNFETLICCFVRSSICVRLKNHRNKTTQIILRLKCLRYFWSEVCCRKPVCTLIMSIALPRHCHNSWEIMLICCGMSCVGWSSWKIPRCRGKCINSLDIAFLDCSFVDKSYLKFQRLLWICDENSSIC